MHFCFNAELSRPVQVLEDRNNEVKGNLVHTLENVIIGLNNWAQGIVFASEIKACLIRCTLESVEAWLTITTANQILSGYTSQAGSCTECHDTKFNELTSPFSYNLRLFWQTIDKSFLNSCINSVVLYTKLSMVFISTIFIRVTWNWTVLFCLALFSCHSDEDDGNGYHGKLGMY